MSKSESIPGITPGLDFSINFFRCINKYLFIQNFNLFAYIYGSYLKLCRRITNI